MMLWEKAWWECRFRVLLSTVLVACLSILGLSAEVRPIYGQMLAFTISIIIMNLAGSGINSQSMWGMFSGYHPSMYFLLSLPVSRRRALLTRTAMGGGLTFLFILLGAVSFAFFTPAPHDHTRVAVALSAILFLTIAGYGLFGIGTFLTTLFDEVIAGVLGLGLAGALLGGATAIGAAEKKLDPMDFVDGQLFLRTGDMAWPAIAVFLIVGTACFLASVYVVERKEY
jgi:ABC-type transport system involved in multi-copper enzyme maturation permease subunit